jgi:hypothetical protein
MVCGRYVTKAYCEHYIGSPIVAPDISDVPFALINIKFDLPVALRVNACHEIQKYRKKMSNNEIGKKNLNQTVILLPQFSCNIKVLQLFQFGNIVPNFTYNDG